MNLTDALWAVNEDAVMNAEYGLKCFKEDGVGQLGVPNALNRAERYHFATFQVLDRFLLTQDGDPGCDRLTYIIGRTLEVAKEACAIPNFTKEVAPIAGKLVDLLNKSREMKTVRLK